MDRFYYKFVLFLEGLMLVILTMLNEIPLGIQNVFKVIYMFEF